MIKRAEINKQYDQRNYLRFSIYFSDVLVITFEAVVDNVSSWAGSSKLMAFSALFSSEIVDCCDCFCVVLSSTKQHFPLGQTYYVKKL